MGGKGNVRRRMTIGEPQLPYADKDEATCGETNPSFDSQGGEGPFPLSTWTSYRTFFCSEIREVLLYCERWVVMCRLSSQMNRSEMIPGLQYLK